MILVHVPVGAEKAVLGLGCINLCPRWHSSDFYRGVKAVKRTQWICAEKLKKSKQNKNPPEQAQKQMLIGCGPGEESEGDPGDTAAPTPLPLTVVWMCVPVPSFPEGFVSWSCDLWRGTRLTLKKFRTWCNVQCHQLEIPSHFFWLVIFILYRVSPSTKYMV